MKLRDDTIAQGMPLAIQRSISQHTLQRHAAPLLNVPVSPCGGAFMCCITVST